MHLKIWKTYTSIFKYNLTDLINTILFCIKLPTWIRVTYGTFFIDKYTLHFPYILIVNICFIYDLISEYLITYKLQRDITNLIVYILRL